MYMHIQYRWRDQTMFSLTETLHINSVWLSICSKWDQQLHWVSFLDTALNLLNWHNWVYDTHYGVSYWHDIYVTCVATTTKTMSCLQCQQGNSMAFSFPDTYVYMYVHAKCKEIHWGSAYKLGSLPNCMYYFINIRKDMHNTMFTKMYRMHYIYVDFVGIVHIVCVKLWVMLWQLNHEVSSKLFCDSLTSSGSAESWESVGLS